MAIVMPTVVDDNGTGTTGTILDLAKWTALGTAIDTAIAAGAGVGLPGTSAPTTTGTQTALAIPTGTGDLILYANNASLLTVQGIVAGTAGQRLAIVSIGAGQVDFAHLHASGTALGKLKLFATGGLTSLAAGVGVATFQYDATVTQWRVITHVQGAPIAVPHSAGNFTASAGNWTVDAGDQLSFTYYLEGRRLAMAFSVVNTDVSATPANLRIAIPVGFTAARQIDSVVYGEDAGTATSVRAVAAAAGTYVSLAKFTGTWSTTAADNTNVAGVIEIEVG